MSQVPVYMLDTNVFNHVLDGKVDLARLGKARFVVTGIQRDELEKTPHETRPVALLALFDAVNPAVMLSTTFAFGIEGAGWGQALWNDGSGTVERMRARLKDLDSRKTRRKHFLNQERDTLIAETAIKAQAVLVTGDAAMRQMVEELGGDALDSALLAVAQRDCLQWPPGGTEAKTAR